MNKTIHAFVEVPDEPEIRSAYIGDERFSPMAFAIEAALASAAVKRVLLPMKGLEDQLPKHPGMARALEQERLQLVPPSHTPDLDAREVGRRLRRWSQVGSLNGPLLTTEFCTIGNPLRVLEALQRPLPDWILLISGRHAFITPEIINSLVDQAGKSEWAERFYCGDGPRGLIPILYRRDLLEEQAAENILLQNEWRSRAIFWGKMLAHVPIQITSCRRTFTLETDRARGFTQAVAAKLMDARKGKALTPENVTMLDVVTAGNELYDLWVGDLPRDVEIEITTRRGLEPAYMPKLNRSPTDMSVDDFRKIVESLAADRETINLTIGGHGDPLEHPDLIEMLRIAKQCAGGVCLRTWGLKLDIPLYEKLVEVDLDVLNARLGYWDADDYREVHGGVDAFNDVRTVLMQMLQQNLEVRETLFPMIAPEVVKGMPGDRTLIEFYEIWGERLAWPVMSNYKRWDETVEPQQAIELFPGARRPCDRISEQLKIHVDGSVPICLQDFNGSRALGNAIQQPLKELWRSERMAAMRASHREGAYDRENPSCRVCYEWFRMD